MVIRKNRKPLELLTVDQVVDALGGTVAVADLTGKKPQQISLARKSGRLPTDTFLIMGEQLRQSGFQAPPRLWGMKEQSSEISQETSHGL